MEVLYNLVQLAEVDYRVVSALLLQDQELSAVEVFFFFFPKRILPLLPLLTEVCSLLHLQGELINLNIL